jgi:hypothetical protein
MKPSPSKTAKVAGGKKRGREEAAGSAVGTSPPVSPPRPDPNREWKKSKAKTEDLLALLNSGFLREKEVDIWRQRPQRRKRRRPPRLDWWTSPASSAPRP